MNITVNKLYSSVQAKFLGTVQGAKQALLSDSDDDSRKKPKARNREHVSKISVIRNFLGMFVALSGLACTVGLAAAEGGALLITKSSAVAAVLDFFTSAFTIFDLAFFVPGELKDFGEQLKHFLDAFSFKAVANIVSKLAAIFFALKWFMGDRFLRGVHLGEQSVQTSSNFLKMQKGEIPWIASAHILRAHLKNLSGYPSTVFAWFGRTALLKHITLRMIPSHFFKKPLNLQQAGALSKVLNSLFYFLLAIAPGWRGQADPSEQPYRHYDIV